jgi:hypothetical protein
MCGVWQHAMRGTSGKTSGGARTPSPGGALQYRAMTAGSLVAVLDGLDSNRLAGTVDAAGEHPNEVLEWLARSVLAAGSRWSLVEAIWPALRSAFYDFELPAVAEMTPGDVDRVASDRSVIRNRGKIEVSATLVVLGGMMSVDRSTERFVGEWFDLLSAHAPVEKLLPMVSGGDLEMVFPERTLRSLEDFRDWYRVVGETYSSQVHVVEALDSTRSGDGQDLAVTVVWKAVQRADASRVAVRARQSWHLANSGSGRSVITRYRVESMVNL